MDDSTQYARWADTLALRYNWPVRLAQEVVWWCWYMDHYGHPDWYPPVESYGGSMGHPGDR